MLLSLVVPCYEEEGNVSLFYDECVAIFGDDLMKQTEIVFVNDGSKDHTLNELKKIYSNSPYSIKIVDFSRNFGKEAALLAGLKATEGDYVNVIDADLQQNPKYVLQMLSVLQEKPEYDAVAAYQSKRKEGKMISFIKGCFYKVINSMTEVEFVESASDFRLLKRKVVNSIVNLPEKCRFSKGIFSWVGFNTYYMPYDVEERASGESKWSFFKLLAYAIDGIVAFSTTPLIISSIIGFIFFALAILFMIIIIIKKIVWGNPVPGFPTLCSLILLTSGIQLFCIGVLGQYLAKNYIESKDRPVYIVKDFYNNKEKIKNE